MLSDIVMLGNKIDIKQLDQMGRPMKSANTYPSKLLDIISEDTISIAMPFSNNHLVILNPGEKYKLCFYTEKGLYQCNCEMQHIYKENNMLFAAVKLISDLEKVQRRQYYRLECIHDIEYRLITAEELSYQNKLRNNIISEAEKSEIKDKLSKLPLTWLEASICDLSGGGARFHSSHLHSSGEKIRIKLDFITQSVLCKVELGADIIASYKMLNQTNTYEHRVEFNDINKKDRESIIRYIFEQDRIRRRNLKAD